jgi:uncharacterized protein (TIGR03067 family)
VFDIEGGSAALVGLTVSGGNAYYGGGLYNNRGTLALSDCTVSGNSASGDGGGLFNNSYSALALTDCTVSGNHAANNGGGLYTEPVGSSLALFNVTVGGNYAGLVGGGLFVGGGQAMLTDCTVSGNTAGATSGGLYVFDTPTLFNTIVAGNPGGDIRGALASGSANNLIGDGLGMTGITAGSQGNQVGTAGAPIDPLLAPLGDYGGPTSTMALLPGSPAIGRGATGQDIPTTDERGQPRTGHVDIGAFQSGGFTLTPAPGSTPQSAAVNTTFGQALAVIVTANNPAEPVDGGVISFAPPSTGASATLSAATAVIAGGSATVPATANVTATANGTPGRYRITAGAAGAQSVDFILTNSAGLSLVQPTPHDVVLEFDGLTSLRAAIAFANSHPGPDTIMFEPAFFGTKHRTIRLVGGPLVLTDTATTTIIGPGARWLTISSGGRSRVFVLQGGSLALSGLTIAGGRGGGLRNDGGRLSLTDVVIRGDSARGFGSLFNDGTATLSHVIVAGNRASAGGGHERQRLTRSWEAWFQRQATETKRLQGTWTATEATRDGEAADDVVGHRLSFTGDRFRIRSAAGTLLYAGTVRADPSTKPAAIDFELTKGAPTGTVWKGIYAFDGDTLTTCDNAPDPGKGRPAAFEAERGSGYVLITFRRVKP